MLQYGRSVGVGMRRTIEGCWNRLGGFGVKAGAVVLQAVDPQV